MGQRMAYEIKNVVIEAMTVTQENMAEVAAKFSLPIKNGQLYDSNGTMVNPGRIVVRFENGIIKIFSDTIFNMLFSEKTYKLSDIPDLSKDIKRKNWGEIYLKNMGYCFVQCDAEGIVQPYQFTAEDFQATDWIVKE